ncbi:hypothetical protein ACRRTK_004082 [Alexandromys fortis]
MDWMSHNRNRLNARSSQFDMDHQKRVTEKWTGSELGPPPPSSRSVWLEQKLSSGMGRREMKGQVVVTDSEEGL